MSGSFMLSLLYSGERNSITHWIGNWIDPKASLDMVAKKNIPSPASSQTLSI
jgi:hypothetical protein